MPFIMKSFENLHILTKRADLKSVKSVTHCLSASLFSSITLFFSDSSFSKFPFSILYFSASFSLFPWIECNIIHRWDWRCSFISSYLMLIYLKSVTYVLIYSLFWKHRHGMVTKCLPKDSWPMNRRTPRNISTDMQGYLVCSKSLQSCYPSELIRSSAGIVPCHNPCFRGEYSSSEWKIMDRKVED